MFGFFKKDRKDPADIAKEFAKENDIKLEDEKLAAEGAASSPDKDQLEKERKEKERKEKEEKSSEEGKEKKGETPGSEQEDKEDALSEEDQKLVDTKDEELDDAGKAKKQELIEKRKKKRDSKAEKRINELISELKGMKEDTSKRDTEYQQKLAELAAKNKLLTEKINGPSKETIEQQITQKERDRIAKYLQEDQDKPREERREMSKDELDEWLATDLSSATEWMVERRARREKERQKDMSSMSNETKVKDILHKQELSRIRVEARNPELKMDVLKSRKKALADEGKTEVEVQKILCEENAKYKAVFEIMQDKEFAKKIASSPNGPELLEEEMLKRMDVPAEKGSDRQKELEDRIAELEDLVKARDLRDDPVGVSVGSRPKGGKPVKEEKQNLALENELAKMKKKGYHMTTEDYNKMLERRKGILGANIVTAEEKRE